MGRAIYCPFPTCKTEYYTYCKMHQALMPSIKAVIDHHDPEGILTESVNISNLQPMIKMLEEQYRENKRLEAQVRHLEWEMARLEGGR